MKYDRKSATNVFDCQRLDFVCNDGVANSLNYFAAKSDAHNGSYKDSLIVFTPAMGIKAAKYHGLCSAIAEQGVDCACLELRGLGMSAVRASRGVDFGYATLSELEMSAAIDRILQVKPDANIILVGHSLGGQLSLLHAGFAQQNHRPYQIVGLGLVASCSIYYKGWPGLQAYGLLVATQIANVISKVLGYFPGYRLGFGGREARTLIADWARTARLGHYCLSKSDINQPNDSEHASCGLKNHDIEIAKLKLPCLSINFDQDKFAPISATNNLIAKFETQGLRQVVLDSSHINGAAADHFAWIKQPQTVADLIVKHLLKG